MAPDLIGFGRSDKPSERSDYSYQRHVDWMAGFVEALDLRDITLVCQDWGALIGLRIAAEHAERFARDRRRQRRPPDGRWEGDRGVSALAEVLSGGAGVPRRPDRQRGLRERSSGGRNGRVRRAISGRFVQGRSARQFPTLVPTSPDDPAAPANRAAWEVLCRWEKPLLTAFSDSDAVTKGGERVFHREVPGAQGQPHTTIAGGGHFLQEDKGEELAAVVNDFIAATA